MTKRTVLVVLTLVFSVAATIPAHSQVDVSSGTIKGTIKDQQGAVIPDVTVTVKSIDRGIARTAKARPDGTYQVAALQPGPYEVRFESQGFETRVIERLELTVGQVVVYDVDMQAGGVTAEVEVTSEAPVIEVARTQQANTINKLQIENLPNIGRDFTSYVFTLPGVSDSNAPRAQGGGRFTFGTSGFSIGGSNGRNNLVTVDGGENEYGSGQLRTFISPEAVQEFQVNRNSFSAEFGFTAGSAVNVITKSGTNNFHGSAYAFYRSQHFAARNTFDFLPKRAFDQQVYPGFTFGGPIVKNKAFFFTNFEYLKSDTARFKRYTDSPLLLPSATQLDFLARLVAANIGDPNVLRIAGNLRNALTTTNFPSTMSLLRGSEGAFNDPNRFGTWVSRLDYQPTARDAFSLRYSMTRGDDAGLGASNGASPSTATRLVTRDYTLLLNWIRDISPSMINQARAQFVPRNSALTSPVDIESTSILISGLVSFGRPFTTPFDTVQDRYQFEDNLSWSKGNNSFKFGVSYRPVHYEVRNELWFGGEWNFTQSAAYPILLAVPAADRPAFLAARAKIPPPPGATSFPLPLNTSIQNFNFGLPLTYRQGFNNATWEDTAHYLGWFAQDSWKVHPRLTLDLGVRFDYDGEPAPVPHHTYVSPRIGFAWDVTGDHKTVIRGGTGLFFSPIYYQIAYLTNILNDSGQYINQTFLLPPAAPTAWGLGLLKGKLPFKALNEADLNSLGIQTGPKAPGRVVFQLDPDYKNNYSYQVSFGINRQITDSMALDLAYQMYRGVHIQMPVDINYVESTTVPNPFGPAFGPRYVSIDPTIVQLNNYQSTGNSIYHGMTASLTKRFSSHFSFQANYTFSKTIDDQTDFNSAFAPAFPTRLNFERGLSSFDVRHNFVVSGVLQSPFKSGAGNNPLSRALADITVSPIIFIRSGIPFSLLTGTDTNGDTHPFNDRLFRIGRNTGIGPNFRSVNLRLAKAFYLKHDNPLRIEFIAEGVNLFNRPNYASVNDNIGTNPDSPDYQGVQHGRKDRTRTQPLGFTSAFDPRRIQFGLKIAF